MCAQDTFFHENKIIPTKSGTIDLSTPVVMGILNITPDSFFDGGKFTNEESMLVHVQKMINEGAGIIDIGAASSRPGAKEISETEELKRLLPALKAVRKKLPDCVISVDTYRAFVAEKAAEAGADMINDISGGNMDKNMFPLIAASKLPYILMHMKGNPRTMQDKPVYKNIVNDISDFFKNKISEMEKAGIENFILDPGFGFGKTIEQNFVLLSGIKKIKSLGYPVLAGTSRKSMINRVLGVPTQNALNGTTVINTIALLNGADILRVHDVREAVEAVKLVGEYKRLVP